MAGDTDRSGLVAHAAGVDPLRTSRSVEKLQSLPHGHVPDVKGYQRQSRQRRPMCDTHQWIARNSSPE